MTLWDYFVKKSSAESSHFCTTEFPRLWSAFVTSVTDSAFSGEAVATPQPSKEKARDDIPTAVPAVERLVAIGDLHGDYNKAVRAFRLAGLTDHQNRWCGGSSVCVQVGDILDRGDEEIRILYLLERLQAEAQAAGGKLYVLNGNHETMTIMGQHRYSTAGAEVEAQRWRRWQALAGKLRGQCGCTATGSSSQGSTASPAAAAASPSGRPAWAAGMAPGVSSVGTARGAIMCPGGEVTQRFFADHPTVLQVGSSVFVHGGVLPAHVDYGLSRINQETRAWMLGETGGQHPSFLMGSSAIVWARQYSTVDEQRCDCDTLKTVLERIPGAERMIMGHTINPGINTACEDRAIRIDVGMSRGCGDRAVEVLEIMHDREVRRLREGLPSEVLVGPGKHGAPGAQRYEQDDTSARGAQRFASPVAT